MTASEKLKALGTNMENKDYRSLARADAYQDAADWLIIALPQIVAVVEVAEATPYYSCKVCGFSPTNRATWCDLGCGRDYNEMRRVPLPALAALESALNV
jgi:hypothetical protein